MKRKQAILVCPKVLVTGGIVSEEMPRWQALPSGKGFKGGLLLLYPTFTHQHQQNPDLMQTFQSSSGDRVDIMCVFDCF